MNSRVMRTKLRRPRSGAGHVLRPRRGTPLTVHAHRAARTLMSEKTLSNESGIREEVAGDDRWRILIRLAQFGDLDAFEQFYLCSARWLLARIRRVVTDGDAEDVLAEVFIQAWRTIGSYDEGRGSPAAWLAMIARSRALDHLRAQKCHGLCVPIDEDETPIPMAKDDPEESFARGRNAKLLHECMQTLEGNERLVLGMSYFSGYTMEEIARALEIPVATVRGYMTRARRKLKARLATKPVESPDSLEKRS